MPSKWANLLENKAVGTLERVTPLQKLMNFSLGILDSFDWRHQRAPPRANAS